MEGARTLDLDPNDPVVTRPLQVPGDGRRVEAEAAADLDLRLTLHIEPGGEVHEQIHGWTGADRPSPIASIRFHKVASCPHSRADSVRSRPRSAVRKPRVLDGTPPCARPAPASPRDGRPEFGHIDAARRGPARARPAQPSSQAPASVLSPDRDRCPAPLATPGWCAGSAFPRPSARC